MKVELLAILREHLAKSDPRGRPVSDEEKEAIAAAEEEAIEILDAARREAEKVLLDLPTPNTEAMA